MSDYAETAGFIPQGAEKAAAEQRYEGVRSLERERRRLRAVTVWGGWATAGMMTCVATLFGGLYFHRPVPKHELAIAAIHDDGTYDAPVLRDDLSRSQRLVALRYTIGQYIRCREEYSWESVRRLYAACSAMSSVEEQARYQAPFHDERNPLNPYRLYGTGASAGRVEVINITLRMDTESPNAVNAYVTLRLVPTAKLGGTDAGAQLVHKIIHLTWDDPDTPVPVEVQQMYDPIGVVMTHYSSDPDPDGGGRL